jgi:hypothetical protein
VLRKIIQISAIPATTEHTNGILALCDDGMVWENYSNPDKPTWDGWHPLPAIPQGGVSNA